MHHLWFLEYLFVYSLLLLPLFWWLRREQGQRGLARATGFLARGWNLLIPAAWISVAEVALRSTFPDNHDLLTDVANHANFLFILLMGFVMASDDRLAAALRRVWKGTLGVGLAAAVTMTML